MIGRLYVKALLAAGKSHKTIDAYHSSLWLLSWWCADHGTTIEDASVEVVTGWLAEGRARWAPSSLSSHYRRARTYFGWLVRQDFREANPCDKIDAPSQKPAEITVPHVAEVQAVIASVAGAKPDDIEALRDHAIMRILVEAGTPRASELVNLDIEDVDLTEDELTIRNGKGQGGGTTRVIVLGQKAAMAITKWLRARRRLALPASQRALFVSMRGRARLTRSGLQQLLDRRCAAAGVRRLNPHAWRHFSADQFFGEHNGTERDGRKLFGWQSESMAHRYADAAAAGRARQHVRKIQPGDAV
jgi:site-specific recombinase XerD